MARTQSDNSDRPKKRKTAAQRRALRCDGGPLFKEMELAEERLLKEQPELYRFLATRTIEELEQMSFKGN